jgi:histidyl-tRNA synthetase
MYSGKDVPAVGVSIGVERVFAVLEAKLRAEAEAASRKLRSTRTQVLVGAFGKGLQVRLDGWANGRARLPPFLLI